MTSSVTPPVSQADRPPLIRLSLRLIPIGVGSSAVMAGRGSGYRGPIVATGYS